MAVLQADRRTPERTSQQMRAVKRCSSAGVHSASPLAIGWYVGCLLWALAAALMPSTAASADDQGNGTAGPSKHDGSLRFAPSPSNPSKAPPRWIVSAEAIFLARSGAGNRSLVSLVPGDVYWLTSTGTNTSNYPGVEALNSNQLGQGLAAGPKLGLAYRDPSGYGVELSYFNVLGLKAAKATGPVGQWLVMKAPGTFWQTQDYAYQSMVWQDDTGLHSLEANARLDISPRLTLLAGVRWLQLRDQLQGTLSPVDLGQPTWKFVLSRLSDAVPLPGSPIVVNPPFWTTSTSNNLFGVQIGAKATIWEVGRFSVEGIIKAGVYDNRANQTTLVSLEKQIHPTNAATNAAAFVGEGGLVAKYQLSDGVALKLGYEALWLGGVALAPGQIQEIATTQTSVSARGVNCRSTALFQGMTFGLEYAF
uniref:Uncharacterized protein n=1 Tax=Rhodopseudomonas palustris (strain BisA53) TaxID=316055 RepID=Q07RD8_RHOP5